MDKHRFYFTHQPYRLTEFIFCGKNHPVKSSFKLGGRNMVEIKTGTMKLKGEGIADLLEHLKDRFSSRLAVPVKIKFSGEISGPMAPWPYYSLVIPKKKKIGPFEYGKNDLVLMAIYPSIYGRARGRSEMFCSLFYEKLESIITEELQRFGELFDIDIIYITEVFD